MTALDLPDRSRHEGAPASVTGSDAHGHDHHPNLAHHFDGPLQQHEAAKLGMWLFLATELLLFGGIFCAYSVYRMNHPEVFDYGSQFLDVRWGAVNTAVLIASSMTMAIAVSAAQRGRTRLLIALLLATFVGGATFMAIKYVEYHHKFHENLVWGTGFYERPDWLIAMERRERDAAAAESSGAAAVAVAHVVDADHGSALWAATCRSCHGAVGEGVTGQGKDLRGATFVTARTDAELVEFLKIGRLASDPLNTTGVQMPPKGGNPLLGDGDLLDIVAHVRTLKGSGVGGDGPASEVVAAPTEAWIPRSSMPPAAAGPPGLAARPAVPLVAEPIEYLHHSVDPARPPNAHIFFGIYFCMTGLHGFHVLVGMIVIGWLAFRSIRGDFGPAYFTPVDLGGLYWHVVDLIWIFLFPLLYLIG